MRPTAEYAYTLTNSRLLASVTTTDYTNEMKNAIIPWRVMSD